MTDDRKQISDYKWQRNSIADLSDVHPVTRNEQPATDTGGQQTSNELPETSDS
jgi:hypothetical protein